MSGLCVQEQKEKVKAYVEKLNGEKKHVEEQLQAAETASAEWKQQFSDSEARVSSLRAQLSELESEVG